MLWPARIKQMLRLLCPCRLSHRSLCPPPERLIPTSLTNLGGNLGVALAGRDQGQHCWPLEILEDYEVQRSCPTSLGAAPVGCRTAKTHPVPLTWWRPGQPAPSCFPRFVMYRHQD